MESGDGVGGGGGTQAQPRLPDLQLPPGSLPTQDPQSLRLRVLTPPASPAPPGPAEVPPSGLKIPRGGSSSEGREGFPSSEVEIQPTPTVPRRPSRVLGWLGRALVWLAQPTDRASPRPGGYGQIPPQHGRGRKSRDRLRFRVVTGGNGEGKAQAASSPCLRPIFVPEGIGFSSGPSHSACCGNGKSRPRGVSGSCGVDLLRPRLPSVPGPSPGREGTRGPSGSKKGTQRRPARRRPWRNTPVSSRQPPGR